MATFVSDTQIDIGNTIGPGTPTNNFSIVFFSSTSVIVDAFDLQIRLTLTGSGFQTTPDGLDLEPVGVMTDFRVDMLPGVTFLYEVTGTNVPLSLIPTLSGPFDFFDLVLAGDDVVTLSPFADDFHGFDGDDTISGGAGDDTLNGDLGNDWLEGGPGADRLFGNAGVDLAAYFGAATGVTADLLNPNLNTGDAVGDFYNNIDGFIGSNFDDTLAGSNRANIIDGGLGDDLLRGRGGNDLLRETVAGGGSDTMRGGDGDDVILGGDGNDGIFGDAGQDALSGQNGFDWISGGDGNDNISGDAGNDTIFGGAGIDTIIGWCRQ